MTLKARIALPSPTVVLSVIAQPKEDGDDAVPNARRVKKNIEIMFLPLVLTGERPAVEKPRLPLHPSLPLERAMLLF